MTGNEDCRPHIYLGKIFLFLSHLGFRIIEKRLWAYRYLSLCKNGFYLVIALFGLNFHIVFFFNAIIENNAHHIIDWLLVSHCA